MKWYDIIFFHVFSFYYKNGKYKNDIPWLTASCIVATTICLYILNLLIIVRFHINNLVYVPLEDNYDILIIVSVINILSYYWFTKNKYYLLIFNNYKNSIYDTKRIKLFVWVFIIFGFILVPISALYVHNLF